MVRKSINTWLTSVKARFWHKGALLRGVILLICGLFLFLILALVVPLITGKNTGPTVFGNNLPIKNPDGFVVILTLTEASRDQLNVRLAGIIAPERVTPQDPCVNGFSSDDHWMKYADTAYLPTHTITELWSPEITELWDDGHGSMMVGGGTKIPFAFSQLCPQDQASIVNENMLTRLADPASSFLDFTLHINAMPEFFFPFDRRSVTASVWLETLGGKRIAPQIVGLSSASQWDTKIAVSKITYSPEGTESELVIIYSRPIAYRILFVVIMLALLSVIIALVFLSEVSSFLEVVVGVLLGLWGVRTILVPPEISGTTIINGLILTLYILLGFAILLRFVAKPIWARLGTSLQHVPVERTDQPKECQKTADAESPRPDRKTE